MWISFLSDVANVEKQKLTYFYFNCVLNNIRVFTLIRLDLSADISSVFIAMASENMKTKLNFS